VPADTFVVCAALSKTFLSAGGKIEALHSIDAAFPAGGVTALVGPSGSGKSTLLRVIAGLDRPTSGTVHVGGRDLTSASTAQLRSHRRNVATYVSQKPADNFIPHLTLAEHAHDAGDSALEILVEVGLSHRLGSLPIELSGGEQARGALALALARETELIVVDEPTAELDRESARHLLDAIRHQIRNGVTFVIATHDPDVTAIADTILRLDRGQVAAGPVTSEPRRRSSLPDGQAQPLIEAFGIGKSYRRGPEKIQAVRDATFNLSRGDLGVLLGRSGSGKSTLLSLLAGWQQPDTGEIRRHQARTATEPLAWSNLGYLPQRFGLIPELTIRENVEFPSRLSERRTELAARLEELLGQLGLGELADRLPHETSIGQQQRAALARALLLRPTVLIADEPTAHQDAAWRDNVWLRMSEAAADGTACLVATHEQHAAAYASRVWRIDQGTLNDRIS